MASQEPEHAAEASREGWSLRRYMALFMGVLLVVAAIAALAVRTMAEQDARQSASVDVNFAAQRAANQLKASFDVITAVSAPIAGAQPCHKFLRRFVQVGSVHHGQRCGQHLCRDLARMVGTPKL